MGHGDVMQGIAELEVAGEPQELRQSASEFEQALGELRTVKRTLRGIELGPAGRLRHSKAAVLGVVEATITACTKDGEVFEQLRGATQQYARQIGELKPEVEQISQRWQRQRELAMQGGPRMDARIRDIEQHHIEQYDDVIRRLGGQQLLHAIRSGPSLGEMEARPAREPAGEQESGRAGRRGRQAAGPVGEPDAGHHEQQAWEAEQNHAQEYRRALGNILGDLDHAVRRWDQLQADMAEQLDAAQPVEAEAAGEGQQQSARLAGEEGNHFENAIAALAEAARLLNEPEKLVEQATQSLRRGREATRSDRRQFDGDERWQLPKFSQRWTTHFNEQSQRLRRLSTKADELREQVRSLDEQFAAKLTL